VPFEEAEMAGLAIRPEGDVYHLAGEFDLAGVGTFERRTRQALNGHPAVVLDLSELTFIDASGLRAIVHLVQRCGGRTRFILRNPQPQVLKVFDILEVADLPGIEIEAR
jgi:anti-anti-sigma factor